MATTWFAGTSGYSYKSWRGTFYPEALKAEDWLGYYASQLRAVEINNTFYRMPRAHVVEGWRDAVPDSFRFALKASRRITHQLKLKNAEEPLRYLAERAAILEHKLGAVLFQLPPALRADPERLSALLSAWPRELPCALEFRHGSWFAPQFLEQLAEHGACLCLSEDDERPFETTIPAARPTGAGARCYLRLRRTSYDADALRERLRLGKDSGAREVLAFFKHEEAGAGPALARDLQQLADEAKEATATTDAVTALPRREPQRAPRRKVAQQPRARRE